jgi:23S rRNA (guanosine2251-2'-O)-methyltransferase
MAEQVWLALDGIEDPMNLGAILRSAACFGVQAALLPERRSAQVTPTVEKAASGGLEAVKVISVGNLNQAILQLRENGFRIVGSVAPDYKRPEPESGRKPWEKGPQPAFAVNYARPMLLVVGSEGRGIHLKVAEKCDDLVYVPQSPSGVESLNASAAAAVLLYEIFRQSRSCQSCT